MASKKIKYRPAKLTPARWQGWGMELDETPPDMSQLPTPRKPKLIRKVEWRSPDGSKVVVSGPFPEGYFRSDTRRSVVAASKLRPNEMWVHGGTADPEAYAKMLAQDVTEGENEFGEVIP